MGSRNQVPERAESIAEATVDLGNGQINRVTVYEDYASQGQKTGYEPVLTRWLVCRFASGAFLCKQFSGKTRLRSLSGDWAETVALPQVTVLRALPPVPRRLLL